MKIKEISSLRNFNDVYSITDLIKKDYESGKNGKPLEYEYVDLEEG